MSTERGQKRKHLQTHRAIKCMNYICIPFRGGKLPDLTSDEFNCKHLRVVYITDKSKYLKGDKECETREGVFTQVLSSKLLTCSDAIHT